MDLVLVVLAIIGNSILLSLFKTCLISSVADIVHFNRKLCNNKAGEYSIIIFQNGGPN